jgi:glutathione synthase
MRTALFVVNVIAEVVPTQTTAMLMHAAVHRGHPTWVTDVTGIHWTADDRLVAHACRVQPAPTYAALCAQLLPGGGAEWAEIELTAGMTVLMRTNPARDPRRYAHRHTLGLLRLAQQRGVIVHNDPQGLARAESKLYLCGFPAEVRPETVISNDPAVLRAYVLGRKAPSILKPLEGTRGRDVFKIDPALGPGATTNLDALLDVLCREGVAIAQAYVPEAAAGDTRVVVLDGEPLILNGHLAAIRRVPKAGDHRSNLHTGGHAEPASLTPAMAKACALIGPQLRADGISLAGLDFIGEVVVEINVFSTGGLRDAERFTGQTFCAAIAERLLAEPA